MSQRRATKQANDGGTNEESSRSEDAAEDRNPGRRHASLTVRDMLSTARPEIGQLLGRPVESVTAVARQESGWRVVAEVVELERIPASTSVVGCYEVHLDEEGHVLEYARRERYYKNRASEDDGT